MIDYFNSLGPISKATVIIAVVSLIITVIAQLKKYDDRGHIVPFWYQVCLYSSIIFTISAFALIGLFFSFYNL